jgi:hypothetical protein
MTDPAEIGFRTFTHCLQGYVAYVAAQLGVGLESCCFDIDERATVYVALDCRLPEYPDRDVALLWDEKTGWTAAVETGCGEDFIVVSALTGDVVPEPTEVARFVAALNADARPGAGPVCRYHQGRDELTRRLSRYTATPSSVIMQMGPL